MVMHSGKSMETVANSVGVSYSALVRWVADAKKGSGFLDTCVLCRAKKHLAPYIKYMLFLVL
jgi:transposase